MDEDPSLDGTRLISWWTQQISSLLLWSRMVRSCGIITCNFQFSWLSLICHKEMSEMANPSQSCLVSHTSLMETNQRRIWDELQMLTKAVAISIEELLCSFFDQFLFYELSFTQINPTEIEISFSRETMFKISSTWELDTMTDSHRETGNLCKIVKTLSQKPFVLHC